MKITFEVKDNYGELREIVSRVKAEANFQREVLFGIQAIQRAQRMLAPVAKDRRIPASIKPARVINKGNTWSAISRTTYPPAVFTNEGTGIHGPKGSKYEITQTRVYKRGRLKGQEYTRTFMHPGIRGTHWWEAASEIGGKIALEAFKLKVARMMR